MEITSTAVSFLYKLHFKHNQQKEILTFFATDTWHLSHTRMLWWYGVLALCMKGVLSSVYPSFRLTLIEMILHHFIIMSSVKQTQLTCVLEKSMITSSVNSSMSSSEFLLQNVNGLVSRALTVYISHRTWIHERRTLQYLSISETMIMNIFY